YQVVEVREHLGRLEIQNRVRPQRCAQLTHHSGGMRATPLDVADRDADPSGRQLHHVVQVATDVRFVARVVADLNGGTVDRRQMRGQQRVLERQGQRAHALVERRVLQRESGTRRDFLDQLYIALLESPVRGIYRDR